MAGSYINESTKIPAFKDELTLVSFITQQTKIIEESYSPIAREVEHHDFKLKLMILSQAIEEKGGKSESSDNLKDYLYALKRSIDPWKQKMLTDSIAISVLMERGKLDDDKIAEGIERACDIASNIQCAVDLFIENRNSSLNPVI